MSVNVEFSWFAHEHARAYAELSRSQDLRDPVRIAGEGKGQLPTGLSSGVWFWRVVDSTTGASSATWNLRVIPRSNHILKNGVLRGDDFDGDGLSDIAVKDGIVFGTRTPDRMTMAKLAVAKARHPALDRTPDEPPLQWDRPEGLGDIDGDGASDAKVMVARRAMEPRDRVPVRLLLAPPQGDKSVFPGRMILSFNPLRVGDINGDGFADVGDCASSVPATCRIFAGGPTGITSTVLARLEGYSNVTGAGDVDGDGISDLFAITKDGQLAFYPGRSSGPKEQPERRIAISGSKPYGFILDDVTADGLVDVLGISEKRGRPIVWLIEGQPDPAKLQLVELGSLPRGVYFEQGSWAYLAGSGGAYRGSLIATFFDSGGSVPPQDIGTYRALQTDPRAFAFPAWYRPRRDPYMGNYRVRAIGDFNGDGREDLVRAWRDSTDGTATHYVQLDANEPKFARDPGRELPPVGDSNPEIIPLEPGP